MSKMSEYHADMYENQPQYYDRKIGKAINEDIHILIEFDHYEMVENNVRAYASLEDAQAMLDACNEHMEQDDDRFSYRIDTITYKS